MPLSVCPPKPGPNINLSLLFQTTKTVFPKLENLIQSCFCFQKISYSLSGLQTVAYQDKTVSDFS